MMMGDARVGMRSFASAASTMSLRSVLLGAALLVTAQGCTKMVNYAVLAPRRAMDDSHGCFRQCQMLHAGQTKNFLTCVDACPESRVFTGRQCDELKYDAADYGCTTAHNQTFDGWSTALLISLAVLANILVFVALAVQNPPPQSP
jgi:hypothetical protein